MKYTIANVVVADNPQLNVTREFLSRSLASLEFDDSFERRIPGAIGFVTSAEPYARTRLVLNLKKGPVASQWSAQIQRMSTIGIVSVYVDGNGGRNFTLSDCAITQIGSGHDGEPTTMIVVDGTITKEAASAGTF